jgi:hypothetical protein
MLLNTEFEELYAVEDDSRRRFAEKTTSSEENSGRSKGGGQSAPLGPRRRWVDHVLVALYRVNNGYDDVTSC